MADITEFYVGYLKMPRTLAVFLRRLTPGLMVTGLAIAWAISRAQNDPGDGLWHNDMQTLIGRISAKPYPHVRIRTKEPNRPIETILLVSAGKRGGGERVVAADGCIAQVRGTILERDHRRLMELVEGDAVGLLEKPPDTGDAPPSAPVVTPAVPVTLRGEIIDPKCYSGAMKPGEGKAHKECATLCISGGIPPMFVSIDSAGRRSYYLLTSQSGDALDERILPYVADAVEISGALESRDDLQVLRIDPSSIRRL